MGRLRRTEEAYGEDRKSRRWIAIVLSMIAPGLGHLMIGYPRRMVGWCSALFAVVAINVICILNGVPAVWVPALFIAGLLRIGAAVDTVRLKWPRELPERRVVGLIIIGFVLFTEIIASRIRTSLIEGVQIPSPGMYPTLRVGDHFWTDKRLRKYEIGDVILFRYPPDPSLDYIKRIVAVGGDRFEMSEGAPIVNGKPMTHFRTSKPCVPTSGGACTIWREELGAHRFDVAQNDGANFNFGPVVIPEGTVFVMGDNRDNSSDSRIWGPVNVDLIRGKAMNIWWSSGPEGIRWNRFNHKIQ